MPKIGDMLIARMITACKQLGYGMRENENNAVNIYLLCTTNREMNELPNFSLKMAL